MPVNSLIDSGQPPPLPFGEVRAIPGRGELFVRRVESAAPDARTVVLIHGWQATADLNFFPLFESLGRDHHVLAADLRGHGRSLYPDEPFTIEAAADDHAALLREFGVGSATIVGYSLGTAVAQMMADRHRDLVAGLVLVGGELAPRRRLHENVYNRIGGWMGTAQRASTGRWGSHRLVDKAVRETATVESLRGWLVREMERGHSGSIRAAGRALGRFDGRAIAERRNVPTVVVVTRRDKLVHPERQDLLAEVWRASTIDLDADHDAPVAQPAAFVDAVLAAVAKLEAVHA